MQIKLSEKPQNATLIEGFPGLGLIGTIVTEFLIEHTNAKLIGEFTLEDFAPTVAVHKGKLIKPLGIYYTEKYNLIILHAIIDVQGKEWMLADKLNELVKDLKVSRIVSIEGVVGKEEQDRVFYLGDDVLKEHGAQPISESIIMGVTAALLVKNSGMNCIFAETHSQLPDSKAAANIITLLDKYLGLQVDPTPLEEQAKFFEKKLKEIVSQTSKTTHAKDQRMMNYVG
ncbi:MAG: proteasome assembly chaperone family protein [Candidatus Woesearchaeota archaeon]|nr:MAG: proteasome assembly chaperone family protein [Candidatus Woesearchaeota archaeon]